MERSGCSSSRSYFRQIGLPRGLIQIFPTSIHNTPRGTSLGKGLDARRLALISVRLVSFRGLIQIFRRASTIPPPRGGTSQGEGLHARHLALISVRLVSFRGLIQIFPTSIPATFSYESLSPGVKSCKNIWVITTVGSLNFVYRN